MRFRILLVSNLLAAVSIVSPVFASLCTEEHFRERIATWVNHSTSELITKYGPPTSTYQLPDGRQVLTFMFDGGYLGRSFPVFGSAYMSSVQHYYCKVNFTVSKEDKITDFSFSGNNCRAYAEGDD